MSKASMLVCISTTKRNMVLSELKQLGYVESVPTPVSPAIDIIIADIFGNIYTYYNNCGVKHYENIHDCSLITTNEKEFISSCKKIRK